MPSSKHTILPASEKITRNLTTREDIVLVHLRNAWNAFLYLPASTDQQAEFRHGIHALQYQIMARPLHQHEVVTQNG